MGEIIGDNNENVGALNKGKILSNYGDSVTKLKVPCECPNEIFRRRLEDIGVELKKYDETGKGEIVTDQVQSAWDSSSNEGETCGLNKLYHDTTPWEEGSEGGKKTSTEA